MAEIDANPPEAEVPSPCTRHCTLDADGRVCLGCRRTLQEIMQWSRCSNSEKARIVAALRGRDISVGRGAA